MNLPHSAIVMAAGLGERMRPLTMATPKPMLKLGGRPLIDYALDHIAAAGLPTTVVNAHYLGDQVAAHVAGRPGIHLQREETLLDTGGSACRALPVLGNGPFFAFNADTVYFDGQVPVLTRMAEAWDEAAMDALLLLVPTAQGEAGDYDRHADGRLAYRPDGRTARYGYRAVSLNHPRMFQDSPEGAFSLKLLWDKAETAGRLFGLIHDGACYHLSTPADLERANRDFT
jgi:MurNAc alpha-1-phosphate uridylyltransferase